MKRWLGGVTVTVTLLSTVLSGCGNSGGGASSADQGKSQQGEQKPAAQTTPAPAASQAPKEKVKLTIGSWRTEDTDAYNKIIQAFEKSNPDIQLEFKPTKNTEYNTALNTALQGGTGPDIIHLRPYAPGKQLADAGYLEPIDNMQGLNVIPKEALLAATGSDNKVYGVPTVYSSNQIFYNKKMFQKYNISEPKTWDELLKAADTLKKNKIAPFAFGSKEGWILSLTQGTLGPQFYGGSDFVKKLLSGEAKFTDKPFVDSLQAMKDLVPYFPDNYVGIGMDDMRNMFVTEQAGMMVMGDWEIAVMRKMNPDLQLDAFPVPPLKADGKPSTTTWVDGSFSVNAKSAHKQEALKFLQFMTTKEFGTLVVNELMKPSTIPGITATDPLVTKISKNADTISTPYAMVVYFSSGNPTTKTVLENSLQGMYLNKLTPEQVAAEVQKSADSWFKPKK